MKFPNSISVRSLGFIFGITRILPAKTEFVRYFKAEPFEILLLDIQYTLAVPILSEKYNTRFASRDFFDWLLPQSGNAVLDPAKALKESLVDAVRLTPTHGIEKDDNLRAE
jgi:hypothetical protein